jgi:hypothetical protein
MTREIGAGYWNDVTRAITQFEEHRPLVLEDAVRAALVLEADRMEWGFLRNEFHAGQENTQPAVVGNLSMVGVENPDNSRVLVIVEAPMFDSVTGNIRLAVRVRPRRVPRTGLITITSTLPGVPRDTRWEDAGPSAVRGAASVITGTNPTLSGFGIGGTRAAVSGGPPVAHDPGLRVVLGPGSDLWVWTIVVNQELRGSFMWRERPLLSGIRA